MRIRFCDCKNHQCLIDVSHCRTYQFILTRQDFYDIAFLLGFIQNLYLYIISDQRFYLFFTKYPFCFTFINTEFYYMNVVESGNSFYNFSLHIFLLITTVISITGILAVIS